MRAALPDQGAFNRGPTTPAGFARPTIDPKEILVISLGIDPINGRAVVFDAVVQCGSDRFMQRCDLISIKVGSSGKGMELGPPERFIGIDITHTGNKRLIEQQRFDAAGFFCNQGSKVP